MSVLAADPRGFDNLAARPDPAAAQRIVHAFSAALGDIAVAHQASIDTPDGRSIRLLYGLPPNRSGPALPGGLRAVRAGLDLQRAFLAICDRWGGSAAGDIPRLELGIGIATGDAPLARDGSSIRSDDAVVRALIERATALSAAAAHGEVLADAATHAQTVTDPSRPRGSPGIAFTLARAPVDESPVYLCRQSRRGRRTRPRP